MQQTDAIDLPVKDLPIEPSAGFLPFASNAIHLRFVLQANLITLVETQATVGSGPDRDTSVYSLLIN